MKCPIAQGHHTSAFFFHAAVCFTLLYNSHTTSSLHTCSASFYITGSMFIFFLRLSVPARNTGANCPSNGNTELKTSEHMSVQINAGFCQSQARARCSIRRPAGKQSCEAKGEQEIQLCGSNESQEIQMCRNKEIPATPLLKVCHCNATDKGTNAEGEKKVA